MPRADGKEQCSCGLWYPAGGAALCAANRHSVKEAPYPNPHRHVNSLELSVEVFCVECSARLSAEFKMEAHGRIVLKVSNHLCPVEEPADISESLQEVAA